MPRSVAALALLGLVSLTGCVERRIEITSEPSGALVYLNDQQVGRTPTEAEFLFHGVYDVRLELDGYEPLRTEAKTRTPIYEHAPLDLVAEALPMDIENVQRWHFVLEPALSKRLPPEEMEAELLARASAMRAELAAIPRPEDIVAEEQAQDSAESAAAEQPEAPETDGGETDGTDAD